MGHILTMQAKSNFPAKSKRRSYICGIVKYTEFGVLERVENNDGWVTMYADDGFEVSMKKIYTGWLSVYEKALKLIGRPIVTETGASASAAEYFREIHEDLHHQPILRFPSDAGPAAQAQIIIARIQVSRYRHNLSKVEQRVIDQAEEVKRQAAAIAAMEEKDAKEVAKAARQLNKEWQEWVDQPVRRLLFQGAANHGGELQNLDRKFMLRLGVDTTDKRRLRVKVVGRGEHNYVRVKLIDYKNEVVEVGLKQSTQKGTRGEWGVCTVNNLVSGWFDQEKKHYPNVKTIDMPLEQIKDAHLDLMDKLAKEAEASADIGI